MDMNEVKVWDPFVRIFHWTVVVSFFIAYFTEDEVMWLHEFAGYTILFFVIARIAWGLIGTRYARFSNFIYKPSTVKHYFKDTLRFKSKRYLGHNPLGGVMVVALLIMLLLTSWSGIQLEEIEESANSASATHQSYVVNFQLIKSAVADDDHENKSPNHEFWEEIHEFLANATLFLVFLHVAGVILSSMSHGENLVRAMVTGRKRKEE
jgi:cytochrome b